MADIEVFLQGIKWVEATAEGDVRCPKCGTPMIIMILGWGYLYAYCVECKCHFRDEATKEEGEEKLLTFNMKHEQSDKKEGSNATHKEG